MAPTVVSTMARRVVSTLLLQLASGASSSKRKLECTYRNCTDSKVPWWVVVLLTVGVVGGLICCLCCICAWRDHVDMRRERLRTAQHSASSSSSDPQLGAGANDGSLPVSQTQVQPQITTATELQITVSKPSVDCALGLGLAGAGVNPEVTSVAPRSLMEQAGLLVKDQISTVNGELVTGSNDAIAKLKAANGEVAVMILRVSSMAEL